VKHCVALSYKFSMHCVAYFVIMDLITLKKRHFFAVKKL